MAQLIGHVPGSMRVVEVRLGGDGDARVTDDGIVLFYNGTNYYNGFVSEYVAD